MRLDAGCMLTYHVEAPTPAMLMLRPRSGASQWVARQEYEFSAELFAVEYTDRYGNLCQRVMLPEGDVKIVARFTVEVADVIDTAPGAPLTLVQDLPDYTLHFLLPSRYCPADLPTMSEQARAITAEVAAGYDQVEAIRQWINQQITYQYGTSNSSSSALDTLEQRVGVCRDFAHLGITLCRSLSIPARMVVGYLHQLDPMDQHAWFEAYCNGRWYTFDATQTEPRGGRIALAYGTDAADVAFATLFGPARLNDMKVWVSEVGLGSILRDNVL
ncbi:MAG: transglutaminase family protein [Chloroflexaceae bacterium]|nr:transglutaminase family protein [Chloroflexaceae bacterium]NJO05172.1 transglutaminase family protein [Chloroflexaceae bacterium]